MIGIPKHTINLSKYLLSALQENLQHLSFLLYHYKLQINTILSSFRSMLEDIVISESCPAKYIALLLSGKSNFHLAQIDKREQE
jgi:hypothetical protein